MRKQRPMTRARYMSRLSRSARWRLPPLEANEVIADYQELVDEEERDEKTLVQELGSPDQAVRLLTDAGAYRRWLWVFGILAFGLFLCAKWCFTARGWARRFLWWDQMWFPVLVMAVGLVLSLAWFRRNGQKNGPLSKWLALSLAAALAFGAGTIAYTCHCFDLEVMEQISLRQAHLLAGLISYGGTACALVSLLGLILARCRDRRWLALYVSALTAAAICGFVIFNLRSMNLDYPSHDMLQTYFLSRLIPIGAAGLVGTGVALC